MSHTPYKYVNCEICDEKTIRDPEAIMQTCDECHESFMREMDKLEFEELYKDSSENSKGLKSNE